MSTLIYGIVRGALAKYGVSHEEQKRLFAESQRGARVNRVSGPMLEQFRALGELVSSWREESPYVDAAGKPRVLETQGKGATFETLARQFLPKMALSEVIALACRAASVGILDGGRIALYGDTLVDLSRNPESVLAQTIVHIRQIFETCLHNMQMSQNDLSGARRLERVVAHRIMACDFERFQRSVHPQIHDLCERVDRLLKSSARRAPRKNDIAGSAGMGIYVYYEGNMRHVKKGSREARR